MTTDNTQELDEILSKSKQIVTTNYAEITKWSAMAHLELTEGTKQAILDWHNKQNVHLLDELTMLVKASQEVNQAFHGRPDCKSCNVQEQLVEIIEAERKRLGGQSYDR